MGRRNRRNEAPKRQSAWSEFRGHRKLLHTKRVESHPYKIGWLLR